jgi:dynein heavy chain
MDDYWGPGKKVLGDPKVIEGLLQLDKDNLPAKASKQIAERVLCDETFDPDKLKAVAPVADGMKNIRNLYKIYGLERLKKCQ